MRRVLPVVEAAAVLLGSGLAALVLARGSGRSGAGWLATFLVAFPASFGLTGRYIADGTLLDGLVQALSLVTVGVGAIALAGFAARFPRPLSPADADRGRGVLLTAAFAAVEAVAEALFADLAGVASIAASVVIALAFAPVLRRVDRWVAGRFEGGGSPAS